MALALGVPRVAWADAVDRADAPDGAVEGTPAPNREPEAIDLTYVARDAAVVKLIRPAAMLGQPELDRFRMLADQALALLTGLDVGIDELEQVTWMALESPTGTEGGDGSPIDRFVLVLQAAGPHDFAGLVRRWIEDPAEKGFQGKTYSVGTTAGRQVACFRPDEHTAILGSEEAVRRMIGTPGGRPEFLAPRTWAEFQHDHLFVAGRSRAVRSILRSPQLTLARTVVAPIAPVWMETTSFAWGLRFEDRLHEHVVAFGQDEQGALRVEDTFRALLTLGRNMADGLPGRREGPPSMAESVQAFAVEVVSEAVRNAHVERSGTVVRVDTSVDASTLLGRGAEGE
ncbi:MAG: hypothetical protein ACYTG0_19360 [Planctomycetota bacterium]|jgi:hypothetical protein